MPYNLPSEVGGDSRENTQWMEECVAKVMKQGKTKEEAIAICKATLIRSKGEKSKASFVITLILDEQK